MAQLSGLPDDSAPSSGPRLTLSSLQAGKKKGCREKKCSKWKGGKCCCGRD
jgi:hypothetical protein